MQNRRNLYIRFFGAVALAIIILEVRSFAAANSRTAVLGGREAQAFYQTLRAGMKRSDVARRAKAYHLWTYDEDHYVIYRSRSWLSSIGCERSVNVRVEYDAHDGAAKISTPSTYVTACM